MRSIEICGFSSVFSPIFGFRLPKRYSIKLSPGTLLPVVTFWHLIYFFQFFIETHSFALGNLKWWNFFLCALLDFQISFYCISISGLVLSGPLFQRCRASKGFWASKGCRASKKRKTSKSYWIFEIKKFFFKLKRERIF